MAFHSIYTHLPEHLTREKPLTDRQKFKPHLPSPLTLVELCGLVINKFPLPPVWEWTIKDVANWVQNSLGFPHYKQTFITNCINGRKLFLIEASSLPMMNITIFEDIKKITAGIRNLFNIEMEKFSRSISLPPRYPETLYLFYRNPTGPKRAFTSRLDFFRMMNLAKKHQPPSCHWDMASYKSDVPGKIIVSLSQKKRPWFPLRNGIQVDLEPKPSKEKEPKTHQYPLRQSLYLLQSVQSW